MPPRALVNVVLASLTVRFVNLRAHSLWLDEGATWSWATRETWGGTVFAEANHPPAWWIVTRLWIGAFGDSEPALRGPAALLGVVTVVLAWLVARRILDPARSPSRGGFPRGDDGGRGGRIAIWFAAFVAGSTFFVEYAQEARMYSALLAETLGLSLLYLRWLDRDDRASLVGYALLAALALHTHYFAVWPIAAHVLHALWLRRRARGGAAPLRVLPFVLCVAAAGVLFLPWFLHFVGHYERIATGRPYEPFGRLLYVLWRVGAGPAVVVVDRARLEEGVDAVLAEEWPLVALTSVLWFPSLALGFGALRRLGGAASFLLFAVVAPVALVLAVFPWFPLVHERYLSFLAPWLWLVAVIGAFEAWGFLRPVLLGGLVALGAMGLFAYHGGDPVLVPEGQGPSLDGKTTPRAMRSDPEDPTRVLHHGHPFGKEPWRDARAFVHEHAQEGDLVVLHPGYLHLVWDYYDRPGLEQVRLPNELLTPEEILARHGKALAGRRRIFLVLAHEETPDPDDYYKALRAALVLQGAAGSGSSLSWIPPILFDRSWGVRVAVFTRS
jgi:hypothetical protein